MLTHSLTHSLISLVVLGGALLAPLPACAAGAVSDPPAAEAASRPASAAFTSAKASFDAGDWSAAASAFGVLASATDAVPAERAEAAAFALRALANAGTHAAVADRYEALRAAAADTPFAAQCPLELARSAYQNARDTTTALALLGDILTRYPSDPIAAPGALYHRGMIELEHLRTPAAALATLETVATSWARSAYADDALAAQARAGVALASLPTIDAARDRLIAMKAAPALLQKVQFDRAEFYGKVRQNSAEAAREYLKVRDDFPGLPGTDAAALARIRAADEVPAGSFHAALALYREAVAARPRLSPYLRGWALLHSAICEFQLDHRDAALRAFSEIATSSALPSRIRAEARLHVEGLSDPDSTAGVVIHFDRAIRARRANTNLDRVYWDLQRIIARSRKPFFAAYVGGAGAGREDRAQMLYRLCFAYYYCGYGNKAFELAGKILEEQRPVGVTRWQCEFMRAHLLTRAERYPEALPVWKRIVEGCTLDSVLPDALLDSAQAYEYGGDPLGAAFNLEEFRLRYPHNARAEDATRLMDILARRDAAILPALTKARPVIEARLRRMPTPPLGPKPGDERLLAGDSQNAPTGGAQ